jgi:gliding motility-associated-like protein
MIGIAKKKVLGVLFTLLSAGTLSAQIQTACDLSGVLSISGTNVQGPSCHGENDGQISLVVSGPPGLQYTYTLTGATSNPPAPYVGNSQAHQFDNLEPIGFYVLEVRTPINPGDPNTNFYSCVQIVNMSPPPQVQITGSVTPPSCEGGSNGALDITVQNATQPYQVIWQDGGAGTNRTGMGAGTYPVEVVDANGCKGSNTIQIEDPDPLVVTPSVTDIKCFGETNGEVSFSAANGTGPYQYQSSVGTGDAIGDIGAGTYGVTVTDANGCTASASFTVVEPPPITAVIPPPDRLDCHGDQDGSISFTLSGGKPGYLQTDVSTGQQGAGSSGSFSGLFGGAGSILVEDANGCTAEIPYNIPQPPAVQFDLSMQMDDCGYGEGAIRSYGPASGGNGGPYTYAYSANGSGLTSFVPPQDFSITDNITTRGDNVTVIVTDKDGCEAAFSTTIIDKPRAVPYIRIERNPCIGDESGIIYVDSVRMNASIPDYTFYLSADKQIRSWKAQPGSGPKGQSAVFDKLPTGGYIMEIEDGKPCGPYKVTEFYLWNGTGYELIGDTAKYAREDGTGVDSVLAASLYHGGYSVMHVVEPDTFKTSPFSHASSMKTENGTIWVFDIEGGNPKMIWGNPAYQLAINKIENLQYYVLRDTTFESTDVRFYTEFKNIGPGTHTIYLSDSLGCMYETQIHVAGEFFIPNLITPNGDGHNDYFEIVALPKYSHLKIFNGWGDQVYYNANYDNSWEGKTVSDGVYYFELELNSGHLYKGWLQVLR